MSLGQFLKKIPLGTFSIRIVVSVCTVTQTEIDYFLHNTEWKYLIICLHINKKEGYSHVIVAFLKTYERESTRTHVWKVFVELVLSEHQACEASISVY